MKKKKENDILRCVMNSLLRLEFFKSLGFPSKESGMLFIKENDKIKKEIDEKVSELEDAKDNIIEYIKECIFSKYEDKKDVFLIKIKSERNEKLAEKKEAKKRVLKEEMREEILMELREEEKNKKIEKLRKKYVKGMPSISNDIKDRVECLEELFISVLSKVDSGDIDKDEMKVIEKLKDQVEKAVGVIIKVSDTLEKYKNE